MNTHKFKLSPEKQRKILKGVSVQLKPDELDGDIELSIPKKLHTKVRRAVRMGKGIRIKLNPEEIEHNGGSVKINRAFRNAGKQIVSGSKKVGKFINSNRKNITKTAVKIVAPIVLKALEKKTGIPFTAAQKPIIDASLHGIDRAPTMNDKKKNPTPVLDVIQQGYNDNGIQTPYIDHAKEFLENANYDGDNEAPIVEGGKIKRKRGRPSKKGGSIIKPIVRQKNNQIIGRKTIIREGGALFVAGNGKGLFPAGGSMVAPRF